MKSLIYDLSREDWSKWAVKRGFSEARVSKIWESLYKKEAKDFEEIDISKKVINELKEDFYFYSLEAKEVQISSDGTTKFLFKLEDGNLIESVLMKHEFGDSLCITSQVGCNMSCAFCASGQLKKVRNLKASEMVLQVMAVNEYLKNDTKMAENNSKVLETDKMSWNDKISADSKISHIVIMGTGEPFDNYDNVMSFIRMAIDVNGMGIAPRKLTVSTCGVVPKILDFAEEDVNVKLAISFHSPRNEIRNILMPINKKYSVEELVEAIKKYVDITKRRVSIEYILIDGITDTMEDAEKLVSFFKPLGRNVMINLIPYNPVEGSDFKRSTEENKDAFFEYFVNAGIYSLRRKERGKDVDAACGQLRSKYVVRTSGNMND